MDVTYTNAGQQQCLTRYSDVGGTARTSCSECGYDPAGRLTALVHRNDNGVAGLVTKTGISATEESLWSQVKSTVSRGSGGPSND